MPVATNASLSDVAIKRIENSQSGFDPAYLTKIESVLEADLANNGYCTLQPCPLTAALTAPDWRKSSVHFVIELSCLDKSIAVKALDTRTGKIKALGPLPLEGQLSHDRTIVHKIADALTEALWNRPGIASSHVLYVLRTRKSAASDQWLSEVWECDYDGANNRQVTHEGHLCVTPTYVPAKNGSRCRDFLFVSYKIGQPKIYACNTQDGTLKRVSYLRGNQLMPCLSPKQDCLAFISDAGGNPDLFVQSFCPDKGLIGKPKQLYSAPMAAQGSPTFSPDGKQIAFVSNKDGTARIYVMPVTEEAHPTVLTKKNRDNTSPAWSLDGKKIAYSAQTNGVRQIWIYDFDKKEEYQLTQGQLHKENPSWASDSLHLMFNTSSETNADLYLINLNQKKSRKITEGPGEKRFPTWEQRV